MLAHSRSCWSLLLVVLCLGSAGTAVCQPRLAVVIVVDQMRASFLDEFDADYADGLRRLLAEGAVFRDAHQDHALTETSPGHATIVTGTYPSRHGIIGNDIWDRREREIVGIVLDDRGKMVGAERRSGRSPHRLQRATLGDWLKQQSPGSKVFGISLKDRSAVFSAGRFPDGAYWYDERTGNFVTSDYYRVALPAWVERFNAARHADEHFGSSWSALFPDEHYVAARRHTQEQSRPTAHSEFPHALVGDAAEPDRRYYTRLRVTPFADELTLTFTKDLIESERLGHDDATDLVVVGLSAADYIGHRYGPWSSEVHDFYVRLDGYLGDFLRYLDARLGSDDYVVVLTADHGVMPLPERIAAAGGRAGRIHPAELLALAEPVVAEAVRRGEVAAMPTLRYEQGVIFDFGDATVSEAEQNRLARAVAARLEQHPFVAAAYTHAQLSHADGADSPWLDLVTRSFYADWSPDVILVAEENHLITEEIGRAAHGSPYAYDSHVPLVFAGAGVVANEHDLRVRTVDIAPTLAALLGLEAPADLDGRDLGPLLRARP